MGRALLKSFYIKVGEAQRVPAFKGSLRECCIRSGKTNPLLSKFGIIDPKLLNFGQVKVRDAYGIGPILFGPGSGSPSQVKLKK
jgi:hypothetical protein